MEKALARTGMAVALPSRTHAPARFDPSVCGRWLDRTPGGLDRVKSCIVEVLMVSGGREACSPWKPRPVAEEWRT